jgi:Na+/H+ antiporter NhaD/arsenite permease-like protein
MLDSANAALVVFLLTYAVLGFGALPPLRIDRTGAALVGATAMVAVGGLSPHQAVAAVDFRTLALLFGMMIVVAHLRLAGFFGWLGARTLALGRTPGRALAIVVALSATLSALFVNDTACLLLTPLAVETAAALGVSPVPFLLAVAMGSNAGSVATPIGNPRTCWSGASRASPTRASPPRCSRWRCSRPRPRSWCCAGRSAAISPPGGPRS